MEMSTYTINKIRYFFKADFFLNIFKITENMNWLFNLIFSFYIFFIDNMPFYIVKIIHRVYSKKFILNFYNKTNLLFLINQSNFPKMKLDFIITKYILLKKYIVGYRKCSRIYKKNHFTHYNLRKLYNFFLLFQVGVWLFITIDVIFLPPLLINHLLDARMGVVIHLIVDHRYRFAVGNYF